MKTSSLTYQSVEFIPERLSPGVLYVSHKYNTATHLCCCGCGEEIVTPIMPTEWQLTLNGNRPTLNPSVGNWSLPCRSHYWIKNGQVEWSYQMSEWEIQRGRDMDRRLKDQYYSEPDLEDAGRSTKSTSNWLGMIIDKIKRWIGN